MSGGTARVPRLVLHGTRVSPFVEKVWRALRWKGLAFEAPAFDPLAFRRVSRQTGKMPVLEIDGEPVFDSTFILRRLDALQPDPPLYSRDPELGASQRLLEDWADEALYWNGMALRWLPGNGAATIAQITAGLRFPLAQLGRLALPRSIKAAVRAQGMGRLPGEVVVRELAGRLDDLAGVLGPGPFLFGAAPCAADFAAYGMLASLRSGPTPEAEALLTDRQALRDWMQRVEAATGGP
jgi:glutathione S-transferase